MADEPVNGRLIHSKYEGSQRRLIFTSFCALIGALNFGIAIGYSSPAIPSMISKGVLKDQESDWFGSLLTVGALLGGPLGGWLSDKVGRKLSLTFLSIPLSAGFFCISVATQQYHCYFGRFLTGIGSGMVTVCVPIYIAEISTTAMRGILGSCVQLFVTIGIAVAYLFGAFYEWRWLATLAVIPCVVGGVLSFFTPETARWLMTKNRKAEAVKALAYVRDPHVDVTSEFNEIVLGANSTEDDVTLSVVLKKREVYYPLFLGISIMIFQQLCGINVVMFYSVSILKTAVGDFAYIATVIIAFVQILGTLLAVYLMDKAGRCKLLHVGGLLMSLTLFCFGLYYRFTDKDVHNISQHMVIVPVGCLAIYIIGFSIGWGPVPMLMMSEIIPLKYKGLAGSLAILASWSSAFIVTSQFSTLIEVLGNDGVFYFYSVSCIVGVWFVGKYLPETKGKSLEDIEMYFAAKPVELI